MLCALQPAKEPRGDDKTHLSVPSEFLSPLQVQAFPYMFPLHVSKCPWRLEGGPGGHSELKGLSPDPSPLCLVQMGRLRPKLPAASLVCFFYSSILSVWASHGASLQEQKHPQSSGSTTGHPDPAGGARPCDHVAPTSLAGFTQSCLPASFDGGW